MNVVYDTHDWRCTPRNRLLVWTCYLELVIGYVEATLVPFYPSLVRDQYIESGLSSPCFFKPALCVALRCFETLPGSLSLLDFFGIFGLWNLSLLIFFVVLWDKLKCRMQQYQASETIASLWLDGINVYYGICKFLFGFAYMMFTDWEQSIDINGLRGSY